MKTKIIIMSLLMLPVTSYASSYLELKQFVIDAESRQKELHQLANEAREEIESYQKEYDRLEKEKKDAQRKVEIQENQEIVAVAEAIMTHETKMGKLGYGRTHNNLCGIMSWDSNGNRYARRFSSWQEGYNACLSLYQRKYHGRRLDKIAVTWSGSDRSYYWCKNVGNQAGLDDSVCNNIKHLTSKN